MQSTKNGIDKTPSKNTTKSIYDQIKTADHDMDSDDNPDVDPEEV